MYTRNGFAAAFFISIFVRSSGRDPAHNVVNGGLYTPFGNFLCFTNNLTVHESWERFGESTWKYPPGVLRDDMASENLYYRHYPVESKFFASAPRDCIDILRQLPPDLPGLATEFGGDPEWHGGGEEPKFSCGPVCHGPADRSCIVWSIGSNAQTGFEEYVRGHEQASAPSLSIEVFDPTLDDKKRAQVDALERKGVFRFHPWGLSATSANRDGMTLLSLRDMMRELNTTWIDYLKVDCEACEFDSLGPLFRELFARDGIVPVTQLQLEIHVGSASGRTGLIHYKKKRHMFDPELPVHDVRTKRNAKSLGLLSMLYEVGFVTFHVDLTRSHHCCGMEYSLYNSKIFYSSRQPMSTAGAVKPLVLPSDEVRAREPSVPARAPLAPAREPSGSRNPKVAFCLTGMYRTMNTSDVRRSMRTIFSKFPTVY